MSFAVRSPQCHAGCLVLGQKDPCYHPPSHVGSHTSTRARSAKAGSRAKSMGPLWGGGKNGACRGACATGRRSRRYGPYCTCMNEATPRATHRPRHASASRFGQDSIRCQLLQNKTKEPLARSDASWRHRPPLPPTCGFCVKWHSIHSAVACLGLGLSRGARSRAHQSPAAQSPVGWLVSWAHTRQPCRFVSLRLPEKGLHSARPRSNRESRVHGTDGVTPSVRPHPPACLCKLTPRISVRY